MNSNYNTNYTKEQIEAILNTIKKCVKDNHYTIAQNEKRQENIDLITNYNLNSQKQKEILLKIQPEDFCYSLQNEHIGFEHEVLYVFYPQVMLFNLDDKEEQVDIYAKFNIIDVSNGQRVIVISFHKRNNPIDYLFR